MSRGRQSKLWIQLPGNADNGDNPQAFSMFAEDADLWPAALARVHGVIVRSTALRGGMFADAKGSDRGTVFLRDAFLPFLQTHGLQLSINCTSAGRAQCDPGRGPRSALLYQEAGQFDRIVDCGGVIHEFRLQSIFSGTIHSGDCMKLYPKNGGLQRRIADVLRFMDFVRPKFPFARFAIADTSAAKTDAEHRADWNYRASSTALLEAVRKAGHDLAAFHLAWPLEEMAPDASDVRAAAEFYRDLGVPWGLVYATDRADVSALDYHAGILRSKQLIKDQGITPDHVVLTSWKTWPQILIPETDEGTFTHTVRSVIEMGGIARRRGRRAVGS